MTTKPNESAAEQVAAYLRDRRFAALTGAGISTESGIPDYRGPGRSPERRRTIWHKEFVSDPAVRKRYWARSAVGWPKIAAARPNDGHFALARLEESGRITGVITQNVDKLHQAAGSRRVIELHGSLDRVRCLDCGAEITRRRMQQLLTELNPGLPKASGAAAPDGDAELSEAATKAICIPECGKCGGILKPDVVFFGDNVPGERVASARELLGESDGLIVLGSSLTVFSGYRFAAQAVERKIPLLIITMGPTRADTNASFKTEARLGRILPEIEKMLALSLLAHIGKT